MTRLMTLMMFVLVVGSAVLLYAQKHETSVAQDRIAELRREIVGVEAEIDVLKAEWTALNEPARLQALAAAFLDLEPTPPDRYGDVEDLPIRSSEPFDDVTGSIDALLEETLLEELE